ncbi:hypothetical protein [Streptomyces sp. NPDC005125]
MHAAAVGEVRGPLLGVVEDVASMRAAFEAQRERADALDRLCRRQRERADRAEQRLDEHRRNLAAILARPGDTPLDELTEYAARTLTRAGKRLIAIEHRATTAEHIAKANMEYTRDVVGDLKKAEQRADQAEAELADIRTPKPTGRNHPMHALLAAMIGPGISDAEARERIGEYFRAITGTTDEQPADVDRPLAEANDRADRHLAAWRNARERAAHRTAQRDRACKAMAAWTDHTARIVADRDQLRAALAHQEQQ